MLVRLQFRNRLEADPRTDLNETGAGSPCDLAVIPRGQGCSWCVEADKIERVGGISAELQTDSTFEAEVARDSQIDVAVTRRPQGIAWCIAVGTARANPGSCAAGSAGGTVGCEGSGIEPSLRSREAVSVNTEERVYTRYSVRPVVVVAVKVFIGACGNGERRTAVEAGDGRDRITVKQLAEEAAGPPVIIRFPDTIDA